MQEISVITITYNNYTELQLTLGSLKGLSIESVLVNGGTCPDSELLCTSYNGLVISEPDNGISDAFNKGFKKSSGKYVTYLNSGDSLSDYNYYAEAVEILNTKPDIDFVYADISFNDHFAGKIRVRSVNHLPNMPFLHPTLIVRRSVIERIGLFNIEYNFAMDLDFAYRLVKSGAKGYYIPRMTVMMDGQGVSSKNFTRVYGEVMKIIYRNKDFSWRSFRFIFFRTVALLIKVLMLKIKGDKLLGWYRKNRYRIN